MASVSEPVSSSNDHDLEFNLPNDPIAPEICRVCRSEGTPDQPLFYPCRCSGSIKFIHQDCLIEWLKHSKKKYCELCKYPFTFSPVYAEQMPVKIPINVLLVGLFKKIVLSVKVIASLSFAAGLWLIIVPLFTSQMFKFYFGWSLQSVFSFLSSSYNSSTSENILDNESSAKALSFFYALQSVEHLQEYILESFFSISFDLIQGFLLTALTAFLIISMMLVREFMAMTFPRTRNRTTNNTAETEPAARSPVDEDPIVDNLTLTGQTHTTAQTQAQTSNPNQNQVPISQVTSSFSLNAHSTTSTIPTGATSPTRQPFQPLSPTRLQGASSLRSPLSPGSNNAFWLDQVHPKEYRNYLRRRELHRELMENEQNRHLTPDTSFSTIHDHDDSEDNFANTSTTSTLRSRFTTRTTTDTATAASTTTTSTNSFRCRICVSNTCINRDHVVQASQMRNALAAQRHQSLLQRQSVTEENEDMTINANELPPTDPQPAPRTTRPTRTPRTTPTTGNAVEEDTNNNFFGFNLDGAVDGNISITEFFGFTLTGPSNFLELLQNASIILGCNAFVMHIFLFIPYVMGLLISNGTLFKVFDLLLEALITLTLKPEQSASVRPFLAKLSTSTSIYFEISRHLQVLSFKSDSPIAYIFTLISGYFLLYLLLSCYSSVTKNLKDSFHRTIIPIVNFLGTFVKMFALILTEMVIFPFFCGCALDVMTISLFSNSSIYTRLEGFVARPVTFSIIHWALGAFFMLNFAKLITFLRSFLRPGLIYFLRNPLDADNHPLTEMIEKSFPDQIYRLGISYLFYTVLIGCSVGLSVKLVTSLSCLSNIIFPLHFQFADPLIEIPIDLILHLLLKTVLKSCSPEKFIATIFKALTCKLLSWLSLSSYFVGGGRYLGEESFPTGGRWVAVPDFDRIYTRRRIQEIRSRSITPLDISRLPIVLDRSGNRVISSPNTSSSNSSSGSKDWTVVFRPNRFFLRTLTTIFSLIISVQIYLMFTFVTPLLIGRFTIRYVGVAGPVHEIYSWTLGALISLMILKGIEICWKVCTRKNVIAAESGGGTDSNGNVLRRSLNNSRTNMNNNATTTVTANTANATATSTSSTTIALRFIGRGIILLIFVALIWPLLTGLLFTFLIGPLIALTSDSSDRFVPLLTQVMSGNTDILVESIQIIFFASSWSIGFPLLRVLWHLRSHLPFLTTQTRDFMTAISTMSLYSLLTSSQVSTLKVFCRFVIPVSGMFLLSLILPPSMSLLLSSLLQSHTPFAFATRSFQKYSYLITLLSFVTVKTLKYLYSVYQNLITGIRDETYLIGRRLHNLENR